MIFCKNIIIIFCGKIPNDDCEQIIYSKYIKFDIYVIEIRLIQNLQRITSGMY